MNILIVSTNRHPHPVPVMPVGACIVAQAAEQAGHRVRLLDLMFSQDPQATLEDEIGSVEPDVVGLSVRNIDNNNMQNPIKLFKDLRPLVGVIHRKTSAPIVLGGSAVAVMPEELLRYATADWAVFGDGEVVFPQLLDELTTGKPRVKAKGNVSHNIFQEVTTWPSGSTRSYLVPDFNRWLDMNAYLSNMSMVPIQSKRGCPYTCIYCTYSKNEGKHYRLDTPETLVAAVEVYTHKGISDFEFVDNVFNSPYSHAMAICEALALAQLKANFYSLELNPRFVDDNLLSAMEHAGFSAIGITAESADDVVLNRLGKGYNAEDVHQAARAVRHHNLPCLWIFMLGGPGETKASVCETLRFAECYISPKDIVFFNVGIRIYPGTNLEQLARQEGVLTRPPQQMLAPVFYLSTELEPGWLIGKLHQAMAGHMNFIGPDSIGLPFLTLMNRIGYRLGVKPPLWQYTPTIRRSLRFFGVNA